MHAKVTRPVTLIYDTTVNFLAHAFLANGDTDAIVGQLCGDFVRGADLSRFPHGIASGIRVHRAIDSYTDQHPLNLQARELFDAPYRRYAGIITDVAYDHYLALDWQHYCDTPLPDYAQLVQRALLARHELLPESLQNFSTYLESENILQNNTSRAHIEITLERISRRRASMSVLGGAAPSLWRNSAALKALFDDFFPQLISYSSELHTKSIASKSQIEND